MKTILLLLLTTFAYSQTYNIQLVGDYSYCVKAKGTITVTEKTYVVAFEGKAPIIYDVVSNRNGVIYITDGYMVDWVQIIEKIGTKKGLEYSKWFVLNFDARRKTNAIVLYYCN